MGETSARCPAQGEAGCQVAQQAALLLVIFLNFLHFLIYCLSAARALGHHLLPSHLLIVLSTASSANEVLQAKGS